MSLSPTPTKLRELAAAIEARERAENWYSEYRNGRDRVDRQLGLSVSWGWASGVNGYRELSTEVAKLVEEQLPYLLDKALENLRHAERAALQAAQGGRGAILT